MLNPPMQTGKASFASQAPSVQATRAADITLGIDHVGRLEAVDGAVVAADVLRLAIRPIARGTALFRGAGTRFEGANSEFGRIKVADGGFGQLDIEDGAVVHAADPTLESGEGLVVGTVNISDGARIESQRILVAQGGVITGDEGVIQLADGGSLVNDGSIEQGTSPGTLTIDGDLVQTDLGQIVFEIGGLTPDVLHDQLIVTGDASIAGTVIFEFIDGFTPRRGDAFDLLSVAGTTDLSDVEFEIANLAPGFIYEIASVGGGLRLISLNDGRLVPEPATSTLVALGLLVAAAVRRRYVTH